MMTANEKNLLMFPAVTGVCCLSAWELTILFSPILPLNGLVSGFDNYLLYMIMVASSLITTFVLWRFSDAALKRKKLLFTCGVILILAAIVGSGLCQTVLDAPLLLKMVLWVGLGMGQVLHIAIWLVLISSFSIQGVGRFNALGNILATLLFVLLVGIHSTLLYLFGVLLIVLGSYVTFTILYKSSLNNQEEQSYKADPKVSYIGLSSSTLHSIVYGFILMYLFKLGVIASLVGAASGVLAAVFVYVLNKTNDNRVFSVITVQYVTIPVIVAGLLFIPLTNELGSIICCCLINVAHAFYRISTGGNLATANQKERLQPIRQTSFGTLPVYVGMIIGSILGFFVFHYAPLQGEQIALVVALIVTITVLVISIYGFTELSNGRRVAHFIIDEPESFGTEGASPIQEAGLMALAVSFGLSTRETDVFLMLARGRNSEHIRKKLMLAPGTVKTHIYHIYQKTGVNSHQQLIDLVESRMVESPLLSET